MTQRSIEEIKAELDCREIYRRFCPDGWRKDGKGCTCPIKEHNHSSPEGHFHVSKDLAFCHGGSKHRYSGLDLYMYFRGLSLEEAIAELSGNWNTPPSPAPRQEEKSKPRDWVKLFEGAKCNSQPDVVMEYLESRGIGAVIHDQMKVGKIGFWSGNKDFPPCAVVPAFTPDNQLVGLQRIIPKPIARERGIDEKPFVGGSKAKQGFSFLPGSGPMVIAGAYIDGASVKVALPDADVVCALSESFTDKLSYFIEDKPVIFYDRDAEEKGFIQNAVNDTNGNCRLVDWSLAPDDCKDVNDLLCKGHHEVIRRMIQEAKRPDWKPEEPPGEEQIRIEIISYADVLDIQLPPEKPKITGLLGENDHLLICGTTGIGKSILTINMALALGKPTLYGLFDTFHIPEPCTTLFIQSENNIRGTQGRLKMILDGNPYYKGATQRIFSPRMKNDLRIVGNLKDAKFQDTLRRMIGATKADVVILDPLVSFHDENENGNGEMRKVLDLWSMVCEDSGVSSIVIHHESPKANGSGISGRGATSIGDWAPNILSLSEHWEQKPNDRRKRYLKVTHQKARYHQRHKDFYLEMLPSLELVKADPKEVGNIGEVVQVLTDAGGHFESQKEFVDALMSFVECSDKTAQEAIRRAVRLKAVHEGKKGKIKFYTLPIREDDREENE